jgi:membrane glycosyltransferase
MSFTLALSQWARRLERQPWWPRYEMIHRVGMLARRISLLLLVAGTTATAAMLMAVVMGANGWTFLRLVVLALFTISFAWLSLSFWTSVLGFIVRVVGGDPASLWSNLDFDRPLAQRTALVMPIYNEDTDRVVAGLEATLAGLAQMADRDHFDVFVLSDTTKPDIAVREEQAMRAMRARNRSGVDIYYRRREKNIGRKAGNLEDFVHRWGGAYAHMIVLDADSVMSGETIVSLAKLMEQNPQAGIIQTIPIPANRETPFARILQFAARLYCPVMASGLAFWAGGDANYYGHNGIIRLSAFARHCGLPILPGAAPLGGEILSHDFVEAALIQRGGYRVWLVPELAGSYEEMPANLIDYAKRDRRWCQGNLQHGKVIGAMGLRTLSRLHLGMGIASYLASPVWFLLLLLASIDILERSIIGPVYFKPGFNLFPDWPVVKTQQIDTLIALTLAALFLPKVMGLLLVIFDDDKRRGYGGLLPLLTSVIGEILFSALLAPVMMLFQTLFVVTTFSGHVVTWDAQARDDRGLSWKEGLRRHAGHTVLGVVWAGVMIAFAPNFFWWMTPVLLGLILSIPLSVLSSRLDFGLASKRMGLFLTPDETRPPAELRRLRRAIARGGAAPGDATQSYGAADPLTPPESGLPMLHMEWPSEPRTVLRGRLGATS